MIEKAVLRYWRNSLADEGNLRPDTKGAEEVDVKAHIVKGCLPTDLTEKLFSDYAALTKADSKDEEKAVTYVPVLLSIYTIGPKVLHGQTVNQSKRKYPLWIPGRVDENGYLRPTADRDLPWIARDCLLPNDKGGITIGDVADSDRFYAERIPSDELKLAPETSWRDLLKLAYDLLQAVCHGGLEAFAEKQDFAMQRQGLIVIADRDGPSQYVLEAYDDYLEKREELPQLLQSFASLGRAEPRHPLSTSEQWLAGKFHLSQMHDAYGLTPSQREAITHYLTQRDQPFFVVNGPPGTGKTTLLQSIVTTEWIQAALNPIGMPPVIVACSSNNQAIDNVLKSFKNEEPKELERWIPDLKTFGLYLPAPSLVDTMEANKDFFSWVPTSVGIRRLYDSQARTEARAYFLEKSSVYYQTEFEDLSIVIRRLRSDLKEVTESLHQCVDKFAKLEGMEKALAAEYGSPQEAQKAKLQQEEQLGQLAQTQKDWRKVHKDYKLFFRQRWFLRLMLAFPWIRKWNLFLKAMADEITGFCMEQAQLADRTFESLKELGDHILQQYGEVRQKEKALQEKLKDLEQRLEAFCTVQGEFVAIGTACGVSSDHDGPYNADFMRKINAELDVGVRHRAFFLATHIWECRWLQAAVDLKDYTGGKARHKRFWQHVAMLKPCMVATLDTGPRFFKHHNGEAYVYADDAIDLLIVDEAGQAAPAKAGAMVAAAKRGLFVGDVQQLEAICTIPRIIDAANAKQQNLDRTMNLLELGDAGILCSQVDFQPGGNLMTLGQRLTSTRQLRTDGRPYAHNGVHLREHWRCRQEIIQFCNELSYDGDLVPCAREVEQMFHPWMYAHVKGEAMLQGGSRVNPLEAESLAEWIGRHKEAIEQFYSQRFGKPKTITDVVGIITPFAAQKKAIRRALNKQGLTIEKVGTVHALQGSEKEIVFFSPVYTHGVIEGGYYFDRGANMLNVAVSRAKDAFVVFGDMDIFVSGTHAPSALMAKYLFRDKDNAIGDVRVIRSLGRREMVRQIHSTEGHRDELRNILRQGREQVIIFSPYITSDAVRFDKLADEIRACSKRATVSIYYCQNMNEGKRAKEAAEMARLLAECGARVTNLHNVHSKILFRDGDVLVEGSFNWLSSPRQTTHSFHRVESSIAYEGPKVNDFMEKILASIENRRVGDILP
jgi:hypothetical protein